MNETSLRRTLVLKEVSEPGFMGLMGLLGNDFTMIWKIQCLEMYDSTVPLCEERDKRVRS